MFNESRALHCHQKWVCHGLEGDNNSWNIKWSRCWCKTYFAWLFTTNGKRESCSHWSCVVMCASQVRNSHVNKVGFLHGHAVDPPLTDTPKSGHLAYEATWHSPDWSAINTRLKITPKCRHHYSVKWTVFLVPLVPGLYKIHSITRVLVCPLHKILHHRRSSPQLDIIIALVHIVWASG